MLQDIIVFRVLMNLIYAQAEIKVYESLGSMWYFLTGRYTQRMEYYEDHMVLKLRPSNINWKTQFFSSFFFVCTL